MMDQQYQSEESSYSSGEYLQTKSAGRQPTICQICNKPSAKYRCPKCDYRTCSVFCTTSHKKLRNCDGIKTQTEYVPRSYYQEKYCKDDYKYLLKMMDGVDKVLKTLSGVNTAPEQMRFKLLKRQAKQMHNIYLKLAPSVIEKHRENISFYFVATKYIFWTFELLYFRNGLAPIRFVSDPVCDSEPLSSVFKQQFFSSYMLSKHNINTSFIAEFKVLVRNTYDSAAVYRDQQPHPAKGKSKYNYIEVKLQEKISTILRHQHISEFPSLTLLHENYVVPFVSKNWVCFEAYK